jgi:DNA-nicking Smr family endonuclease
LGDEEEHTTEEQPTRYPIDGVLDLHEFRPQDTGSLVPEYLRACRAEGILRVRIVHGKGTGAHAQNAFLAAGAQVLRHETARVLRAEFVQVEHAVDGVVRRLHEPRGYEFAGSYLRFSQENP